MNLSKKKEMAARTLKVGKEKIVFAKSRLEDIKDAITKQDIRDLYADKAITVKNKKGRKKVVRKRKKSVGNIRKNIKNRKGKYIILTRKLRKYVADLKKQGKLSPEETKEIRKKIRNKAFRSKAHIKEQISGAIIK